MTPKSLAKSALAGFLAAASSGREVFAPVNRAGKTVWAVNPSAGDVVFDFVNTTMSPKAFFLPQTECLSAFRNVPNTDKTPDGLIHKPADTDITPRLLLFMRPCDAKALVLLDGIFSRDALSTDPFWFGKRAATVIVGLGCENPCPTCFCDRVDCGPHATDGLDVLATDLGDTLLLTPVTDKGADFLSGLGGPGGLAGLTDAAPSARDLAAYQADEARRRMSRFASADLDPKRIQAKTLNFLYRQRFWQNVGSTCLSCGVCTFTCPTCHCFDIQDETRGVKGRRVRNWDFCTSALFTRHASGHNPRPRKFERLRQRFLHKLKYIPENRNGAIGCVGCGRCVRMCPSNIDIREVIRLCQNAPEVVHV